MSASPEVDAAVKDIFSVRDIFQLPDGEFEYKVAYDSDSKVKFIELHKRLGPLGLVPALRGTREECSLLVRKRVPTSPRPSRIPVILLLLTLGSIFFLSLFERISYEDFVPSLPGYVVLVSYWAGVVALLGAHALGRFLSARRSVASAPNPYLVPGIPYVTSFLPTLGFVSIQREPSLNRDKLFDVMLAGPLLILLAAVVIYALGAFASTQSSIPLASCQRTSTYISTCPGGIQSALDALLRPFTPAAAEGFLRLSPLQDAAIVGFLLTFIGLLPMASFDGGYLSSLAWGARGARVATYLSVLLLIIFDTPLYWGPAIVVLLLAGRQLQVHLLDEVSGLSTARRYVYAIAILLAFLSVPLPQTLATVQLG